VFIQLYNAISVLQSISVLTVVLIDENITQGQAYIGSATVMAISCFALYM